MNFSELRDFFAYMSDQEVEDRLWEQYLHTFMDVSFGEFLRLQKYQRSLTNKRMAVSEKSDKAIIQEAMLYVKVKGDKNGR